MGKLKHMEKTQLSRSVLHPVIDLAVVSAIVFIFPAGSLPLQLILIAYGGLCCMFPNPALRIFFPLFAIASESVIARFTVTIGSNLEKDYFLFITASVFWAVVVPPLIKKRQFSTSACVIALSTSIGGYMFLNAGDHIVKFFESVFLTTASGFSSQLHIALLGLSLIALFLAGSIIYHMVQNLKNSKITAYAWSYAACSRAFAKLGKKWKI